MTPRLRRPSERPESGQDDNWLVPLVATGPLRLQGDVAGLCRVVAEEDLVSAAHALDFLADLADPAATDLLLAVLEDPDGFLYHGSDMLTGRAAVALGRLGEVRAVPALIRLLSSDPPPYLMHDFGLAAALIGDPTTIPPLVTAARDDRQFAEVPAAREALQALARFDPDRVVPVLLAELWAYVADARGPVAVQVLGELGSSAAIPALTYLAFGQRPPALRRAAIQALTQIADVSDISYRLIPLLDSADPWTAKATAEVFARSDRGREWLVRELLRTPVARQSACHGLGATGDQRFVGNLAERLRTDTSAVVRRAAATALRDIGGPEAASALFAALGDKSVSDIVIEAVEPPLTDLLALVEQGEPTERRNAARLLGRSGDAQAGAKLFATLENTAGAVRAAVVEALGALRYRPALESLVAIANNAAETGAVRGNAVRAAAVCGDRELALRALGDPVELVRIRAAEAFGDDAMEVIANDTAEVQLAAVKSLRSGATLLAAFDRGRIDSTIRRQAAEQLARCADPTIAAGLGSLAFDDDHAVALSAVTALAGIDDPQAIEPLIGVLSRRHPAQRYGRDPRHVIATNALARFDDDRAIAAVAEKAVPFCRDEARAALTAIAARRCGSAGRSSPGRTPT